MNVRCVLKVAFSFMITNDCLGAEAEVDQRDLNVGYLEAVFFDRILYVIIISDLIYIIR